MLNCFLSSFAWMANMDMGWKHWASESVKGSCNSTFCKMVNPAFWKEQKNCVSFHRTKWKIGFFLNFSPNRLALTKRRTILYFVSNKNQCRNLNVLFFFSTSSPSRDERFVKKYNWRGLQCFQVSLVYLQNQQNVILSAPSWKLLISCA